MKGGKERQMGLKSLQIKMGGGFIYLYCFWNNWEQNLKGEYTKNTLKTSSETECWDCVRGKMNTKY